MIATIIALGLVNWLATTILVESELTRPLREWFDRRAEPTLDEWQARNQAALHMRPDPKIGRSRRAWAKAAYLVHCHLCAGTWIGLVLAAVVPVHPFGAGFVGWVLAGLLIKAVGHLVLVAHKAGERAAR